MKIMKVGVIKSFLDLQDKLPSLSIPKTWSLWYTDERTLIFIRPNLENCKILLMTTYW